MYVNCARDVRGVKAIFRDFTIHELFKRNTFQRQKPALFNRLTLDTVGSRIVRARACAYARDAIINYIVRVKFETSYYSAGNKIRIAREVGIPLQ